MSGVFVIPQTCACVFVCKFIFGFFWWFTLAVRITGSEISPKCVYIDHMNMWPEQAVSK